MLVWHDSSHPPVPSSWLDVCRPRKLLDIGIVGPRSFRVRLCYVGAVSGEGRSLGQSASLLPDIS